MTHATITLLGVEARVPEDSPYFEFDGGLDGFWRFLFPDPLMPAKSEFPDLAEISDHEWNSAPIRLEHLKPWELAIIADVAWAYWVRKAEKLFTKWEQTELSGYSATILAEYDAAKAYASAWQRVGALARGEK